MQYTFAGEATTPTLEQFAAELARALENAGFAHAGDAAGAELVLNLIDPEAPKPFRRHSRGTFVAALHERPTPPADVLLATYPLLVRALANVVLCYVPPGEVWFTTMERGAYVVRADDLAELAEQVLERLAPLAQARLVIDNEFRTDLEPELWEGDELTAEIREAGARLGQLDLLPGARASLSDPGDPGGQGFPRRAGHKRVRRSPATGGGRRVPRRADRPHRRRAAARRARSFRGAARGGRGARAG